MQRAFKVCRLYFTSDVMSGDVSGSATVFSLYRQRDSRSHVPSATAADMKYASRLWSTLLVGRNLERLHCLLE